MVVDTGAQPPNHTSLVCRRGSSWTASAVTSSEKLAVPWGRVFATVRPSARTNKNARVSTSLAVISEFLQADSNIGSQDSFRCPPLGSSN